MHVRLHPHAVERMAERGATDAEVRTAMDAGESFPAKYGRTGFRRNFAGSYAWRGRQYTTKQLEVYAVREDADWLVISCVTRYF